MVRLVQLARTGNLDAVLCLGRAVEFHPMERIREQARQEVERARPLLEKALEDPDQPLLEIARHLGEDALFAARVREQVAGPLHSWPALERMARMLSGRWREHGLAHLAGLAPQGPLPVQAAMLLLAGRFADLQVVDPEGQHLQRAVQLAPPNLRSMLLGEMRRAGITGPVARRPPRVVDPARWSQELRHRVEDGDWEALLRQLEGELPLRAHRLIQALAEWSECPPELEELAGPVPPWEPTALDLTGTDGVWSPDD
ncbi:MAG: hypothetical protein AB1758_10485, partial [Candidatus Eremiobacterota bacterium]